MQLIIHPHELTPRWIELAKKLKVERISLHPVGGKQVCQILDLCCQFFSHISVANSQSAAVEFSKHIV